MPQSHSPMIRVHPVIIFLTALIAGNLVKRWWPVPDFTNWMLDIVAYTTMIVGALLILFSSHEFSKLRISTSPNTQATQLITSGPYRYSRNPIYVGFILILIGIACKTGNPWLLITALLMIPALYHWVIKKEEKHLQEALSQEYQQYVAKVRRWL